MGMESDAIIAQDVFRTTWSARTRTADHRPHDRPESAAAVPGMPDITAKRLAPMDASEGALANGSGK
jgi:hypothetical protein